jgi:hypothetical protein
MDRPATGNLVIRIKKRNFPPTLSGERVELPQRHLLATEKNENLSHLRLDFRF